MRCGALLRDIGQTVTERPDPQTPPAERAAAKIAHVEHGLRIAKEHRIPRELCALIAEHHGTTELTELLQEARGADPAVDPAQFRYPGPKPTTLESAVLLIATEVERASRQHPDVDPPQRVRDVLARLMLDVQFDDCQLTQGQLCKIQEALIAGEAERR
jgi:putative nucleotidyltransferase with HDIG domain